MYRGTYDVAYGVIKGEVNMRLEAYQGSYFQKIVSYVFGYFLVYFLLWASIQVGGRESSFYVIFSRVVTAFLSKTLLEIAFFRF